MDISLSIHALSLIFNSWESIMLHIVLRIPEIVVSVAGEERSRELVNLD